MAVAVIFGLGVATLLTLGVVPALYVILDPIRGKSHRVQESGREDIVHPETAQPEPVLE